MTPNKNDDPLDQIVQREKKDAAMKPTLQAVVAAFDRDIVEGGLLTKALAAGSHVKEIMQEINTTLGAYLSILPEKIVFDKFLREDPGLLTGPTFKERLSKAKDKYQEFFAEHVLPTAPNPGDVFKEIFDEQVKQQFGEKGPSIIPQVDASNLGPHGVIFRDLATDLKTLREVASCDAGCKDGVGLHPPSSDGRDPSCKALAKNLGTAAKVIDNAAGFGYAPLEIYQYAKALKDSGNQGCTGRRHETPHRDEHVVLLLQIARH